MILKRVNSGFYLSCFAFRGQFPIFVEVLEFLTECSFFFVALDSDEVFPRNDCRWPMYLICLDSRPARLMRKLVIWLVTAEGLCCGLINTKEVPSVWDC